MHERLRTYTYIYARPGDQHRRLHGPGYWPPSARAEYLAQGFTALKFDPAGPYTAFDGRQLVWSTLDRCERFCSSCARRSARAPICCSARTAR